MKWNSWRWVGGRKSSWKEHPKARSIHLWMGLSYVDDGSYSWLKLTISLSSCVAGTEVREASSGSSTWCVSWKSCSSLKLYFYAIMEHEELNLWHVSARSGVNKSVGPSSMIYSSARDCSLSLLKMSPLLKCWEEIRHPKKTWWFSKQEEMG